MKSSIRLLWELIPFILHPHIALGLTWHSLSDLWWPFCRVTGVEGSWSPFMFPQSFFAELQWKIWTFFPPLYTTKSKSSCSDDPYICLLSQICNSYCFPVCYTDSSTPALYQSNMEDNVKRSGTVIFNRTGKWEFFSFHTVSKTVQMTSVCLGKLYITYSYRKERSIHWKKIFTFLHLN